MTSLCSASYVTDNVTLLAVAAERRPCRNAAVDRNRLPTGPTAANPLIDGTDRWLGQTDGQTH